MSILFVVIEILLNGYFLFPQENYYDFKYSASGVSCLRMLQKNISMIASHSSEDIKCCDTSSFLTQKRNMKQSLSGFLQGRTCPGIRFVHHSSVIGHCYAQKCHAFVMDVVEEGRWMTSSDAQGSIAITLCS